MRLSKLFSQKNRERRKFGGTWRKSGLTAETANLIIREILKSDYFIEGKILEGRLTAF
jgi:hypothetical protein